MPYQSGYVPDYSNYGSYTGGAFPVHEQTQQAQTYDQQAGPGTWAPQQHASFHFTQQQQRQQQQQQSLAYQQAQFSGYQQQYPQVNHQQQPFLGRPGQPVAPRPVQSPVQSYGHNFQSRQQQQSTPQFQNTYPELPSSPDPLQYYQPPPRQLQQTSSHIYQQGPHRSPIQASTPRPTAPVSSESQQLFQERARPPKQPQSQFVQPVAYIPSHTQVVDQRSPPQQPNAPNVRVLGAQMGQQPSSSQTSSRYQPLPPQGQRSSSKVQQQARPPTQAQHSPSVGPERVSQSVNTASSILATIEPSLLQKKVTHVQIPVQPVASIQKPDVVPTPKRRKSNDGEALRIPKNENETSQVRSHQPPPPPPLPSSSPLSELRSSQIPPTPVPQNVNYQTVLLELSDEYIGAAYNMSASVANADVSEEQLHTYHDLLASGMGCLETILKNYRIPDARREAQIRLRFASLLCEETENNDMAEEVLAKGFTVCERARLIDLKYAMHHVLARVWFKGNKPRAALKAIDKLISEVEKLGLTYWVYTFRLLSVSLSMQMGNSHAETIVAIKQLAAISHIASSNSHVVVHIVACTLEALLHLRSQAPEGVEMAQRSIAAARTYQLSPEMASLPQARILLDCIDLACSLMRFNADQVATKLKTMQDNLDGQAKSSGWSKDGGWLLPLGQFKNALRGLEADTCGIMRTTPDGQVALVVQWLPRSRVYMLGFLLSGLASMHKSTIKDRKAESFFKEGLKLTNIPPKTTSRSLTTASAEVGAQQMMRVVLQLYVVFAYCSRSNWGTADKAIIAIRKDLAKIESRTDRIIPPLLAYLEAISKHGQGDLASALKLYRGDELVLPEGDLKPGFFAVEPLRILSGLNSILILRGANRPGVDAALVDIAESDRLLSRLEPACKTQTTSNGVDYGSKSLEAALNILKATSTTQTTGEGTIIQTKQYLTAAAHAAKRVVDNRLMCVVMNRMTQLFFTSMVGEQAEKSAGTSRGLAEKSQDKLWIAVANRMYGDIMDRSGRVDEAMTARSTARESMYALPEMLKIAHGVR